MTLIKIHNYGISTTLEERKSKKLSTESDKATADDITKSSDAAILRAQPRIVPKRLGPNYETRMRLRALRHVGTIMHKKI